MFFKKTIVSFILFISLSCNISIVSAATLIPGGQSIGIVLDYQGVIITGGYHIQINQQSYNPLDNGLQIGDKITKVNDQSIVSLDDLSIAIEDNIANSKSINLVVERNSQQVQHVLLLEHDGQNFNSGLYVKDSISGIGTITYYNPSTGSYGALGHALFDDNSTTKNIETGNIFGSDVLDVEKGMPGSAGQKIANINDVNLGIIDDHGQYGIYGNYDATNVPSTAPLESATIEEVQLGEAYFYTVIDGNNVEKYTIEITDLEKQEKMDVKGITFTVVDQELLAQTNGIIQGMSGSPIIQNNKIVGAITHVSSNDPSIGYGLFIEWMIENDNLIKS